MGELVLGMLEGAWSFVGAIFWARWVGCLIRGNVKVSGYVIWILSHKL